MAFSERSLDDYVDVAQRIADFRALYPDGSLQPADPAMPYHVVRVPARWCRQCIGRRVIKSGQSWKDCPRCNGNGLRQMDEPDEDVFVVYSAAAYRTPDDPRPGMGMAWEAFPGQTPYTAGSELMNAETSAWGRAIVAVLASDSKAGVASRQEVKARRAEREDGLPTNADGTLSRSRTTDAEKDAAGVMTSAQQAEHTALQPKRAEMTGTVTRLPAQPASEWDTPLPPEALTPEQRPGSIGPGQRSKIMAAVGKLPRDERLARVGELAGRAVESINDLSYAEAQKVLAGLGGAK